MEPHEELLIVIGKNGQERQLYQWAEVLPSDEGEWNYNITPYRIKEETKTVRNWQIDQSGQIYDYDLFTYGEDCSEGVILSRYKVILSDGSAHILHPGGYEYLASVFGYLSETIGSGFYPINRNGIVDRCFGVKYNGLQHNGF